MSGTAEEFRERWQHMPDESLEPCAEFAIDLILNAVQKIDLRTALDAAPRNGLLAREEVEFALALVQRPEIADWIREALT